MIPKIRCDAPDCVDFLKNDLTLLISLCFSFICRRGEALSGLFLPINSRPLPSFCPQSPIVAPSSDGSEWHGYAESVQCARLYTSDPILTLSTSFAVQQPLVSAAQHCPCVPSDKKFRYPQTDLTWSVSQCPRCLSPDASELRYFSAHQTWCRNCDFLARVEEPGRRKCVGNDRLYIS